MKIALINTYDIQGGAARSAYRLHQGFQELGQDSTLISRYKVSNDSSVIEVKTNIEDPEIALNVIQDIEIDRNRSSLTNTYFSLSYPGYDLRDLLAIQQADVINLHWVARFQSPASISHLKDLKKPIVWTLHDMWAFTGGCHFSAACLGYQNTCVNCPQLIQKSHQLPAHLLKDKLYYLENTPITIVTPSRWLADCAQKSSLFKNHRIEVIPYGLETDVFVPLEKSKAKQRLDIPEKVITILFCAMSHAEERKGFTEMVQIIYQCLQDSRFSRLVKEEKIELILVGDFNELLASIGIPIRSFGQITDNHKISQIYAASDVFVLPTLEDNLPNTMLEAMSCGTPVIAFDVGGVPDVVIDAVTGKLIPLRDTHKFAEALLDCIFNPIDSRQMGLNSRKHIESHHSLSLQAQQYLNLFQDLLYHPPSWIANTMHGSPSHSNQANSETTEMALFNIDTSPDLQQTFDQVIIHSVFSYLKTLQIDFNTLQVQSLQMQKSLQEKESFIQNLVKQLQEKENLLLKIMAEQQQTEALLQDISTQLKEKETLTNQLLTELQEKENLILNVTAKQQQEKDDLIQHYGESLLAKEKAIQNLLALRPSSIRYWIWNIIDLFKGLLNEQNGHKLLITPQYSPRPIEFPKSYYQDQQRRLSPIPRISIVTPSYNHAQFIEYTIESVLNQDYPELEYIVQDGKSRDNTAQIVSQYGNKLKFISEKDTGQAQAINRGFTHTQGEIMAWLNSDDLLLPGTLFYVANYFNKHPEIDVIYGHRIIINEANEETGRWVLPPHDDKMLLWADYVPQETLFWRRDLWNQVGGYIDESFQFAIDWDLLLRFRAAGASFARVPRFLGAFRVHSSQKTQDWNEVGESEMSRLRYQCHQYVPSPLEVKENIKNYIKKSFIHYQLYRLNKLRKKYLV